MPLMGCKILLLWQAEAEKRKRLYQSVPGTVDFSRACQPAVVMIK